MFSLPQLLYKNTDMEPFLDELTVNVHYLKHHQNYCNSINSLVEVQETLHDKTIETILSDLTIFPSDIRHSVINNGGGYYNHNVYWENIGPQPQKAPDDNVLSKILEHFSTFTDFQKYFSDNALRLFGSGWTWLVQNKEGMLSIVNTANQDCPLSNGLKPILVLDVWEHAYYLKYQNRRVDYIQNFWNAVNWDVVAKRINFQPL